MVHTHQVQASHVVETLTDIHLRNPAYVQLVMRDRVTTTPTPWHVKLMPDGHLLTTPDLITATVSATVLSYPVLQLHLHFITFLNITSGFSH